PERAEGEPGREAAPGLDGPSRGGPCRLRPCGSVTTGASCGPSSTRTGQGLPRNFSLGPGPEEQAERGHGLVMAAAAEGGQAGGGQSRLLDLRADLPEPALEQADGEPAAAGAVPERHQGGELERLGEVERPDLARGDLRTR